MSALHVKLFNIFKEPTDKVRNDIGRHIFPILDGGRAREHDTDAKLAELYEEWKACGRAAAAAENRPLYPNEKMEMPVMPVDDEEHQPCRQMAAAVIERTIYDEHTARVGFEKAAQAILNHPNCANHSYACACHEALNGWTYGSNQMQVQLVRAFYTAHYEAEKNEDYLQAVRDMAHGRGITFEAMLEKERAQKAKLQAVKERAAAAEEAKAELRKQWVFICYQDCGREISNYNGGKTLHGFYRAVKTADCYEFTLMECNLGHPDWQNAVANKEVWRFPLDMPMGKRSTAFENVTPDKIHVA